MSYFQSNVTVSAQSKLPSKPVGSALRNSGYEPDDEDDNFSPAISERRASRSTTLATTREPVTARDRSQQRHPTEHHSAEKARQRSRSQSGADRERRATAEHRTRSSSASRATSSRADHLRRPIADDKVTRYVQANSMADDSLHRFTTLRTAQNSSSAEKTDHGSEGPSQARTHTRHRRSNSDGSHKNFSHQQYSNSNHSFEKFHSAAATILSPVSEIFDTETTQESQEMSGNLVNLVKSSTYPPVRRDELEASDDALQRGTRFERSHERSQHPQMLNLKHGRQFINPLAAHSTVTQTVQSTSQSGKQNEHDSEDKIFQIRDAMMNKPLPPDPISAGRAPTNNTTYKREPTKVGPGLEATAIMRPSSRANSHSAYTHSHGSVHSRNTSVDHSSYSPAAGNSRKGSCADEYQSATSYSLPSSAGSGLTPDSLTNSSGPTPSDSPDTSHSRKPSMSPTLGFQSRRSIDETSNQTIRKLSTTNIPAEGLARVTSPVGGNIYNEIRDDLASVARDLTEMNLAKQKDRESKLSKLRARARSSSRNGRRSERQKEHSTNYIYREIDKSELKGQWGNVGFVPAYDLPRTTETKGDFEPAVRLNEVEIVPEYEDLWG